MNPEVLRIIPKRMITNPEILGRVCWNLADRLTGGRWLYDEVRASELTRMLSEKIGVGTMVGDREVFPTYNDIRAEFYAKKEAIESNDEKLIDIDTYRLVMSVTQSIDESDVPPYVLDEIFSIKDDNDSEFETVLDRVSRNNLNEVEITREQIVIYDITGEGEVEGYELNYTYSFDDEGVHEATYNSEEGVGITSPIKIVEAGKVEDERPAMLLVLTSAQLEKEIQDLDAKWVYFMEEQAVTEIVSFGAQSSYQHRQQALAIVGLISSGMYTLRDLASTR